MANGLRDLFLLDEEVTFLNHGSYGACPKPVFARYQEWQLQLERQPVAFLDIQRGYGRWMAETAGRRWRRDTACAARTDSAGFFQRHSCL